MTQIQREALRLMAEQNLGAVNFGKGWIYVNDVRESESAAWTVVNGFRKRCAA
jgi:hypothetical protein